MSVKSYFDAHGHNHAYNHDPQHFRDVMAYIKRQKPVMDSVLDVGCGSGMFLELLRRTVKVNKCYGVDLSETMIQMASDRLGDSVELRCMDAFDLEPNRKYDLIHIDSVLHHLVGRTRRQSKQQARRMVAFLSTLLKPDGILIIEEMVYTSFGAVENMTSRLIFYGLKLLNKLNIDLHRWVPDVQLGLEVNFLTENEILAMPGQRQLIAEKTPMQLPILYRLLFLKRTQHRSYSSTAR